MAMADLRGPGGVSVTGHGLGRALALLHDRSDAGRARLFAASAFAARVTNAGLGFLIQIVLARWMGEREYGVYSAAWVWFLTIGGVLSLGLPVAALKLVPDYRERGDAAGLRGFLDGARLLGALPSVAATAVIVAALWLWGGKVDAHWPVLAIALLAVPAYVLMDIQTGIARASDYAGLGLMADYVVRPLLLLLSIGFLWSLSQPGTAATVMAASAAGVVATAAIQGVALQRRLRGTGVLPSDVAPRRDVGRWAVISWPLLVELAFTLLLQAADIIVLQLFVEPEVLAPYYAATKIVAIASFVAYGVASTSAHRFAARIARGDRDGMASLAAQTVRWTFWPTLAVAVVLSVAAPFLLQLFGPGFGAGAPLVAILACGVVAGAAVGPADRALSMADEGRVTAAIYAVAFLTNVTLCLLLVPRFGPTGAAIACSLALVVKSLLLYEHARRRLGLRMSILSAFPR
jgi:O-antigen/teichoic acid export membrane protein